MTRHICTACEHPIACRQAGGCKYGFEAEPIEPDLPINAPTLAYALAIVIAAALVSAVFPWGFFPAIP